MSKETKYIHTCWLLGVSLLYLGISSPIAFAGCNSANGITYDIAITGGSDDVEDGETSTYTCTMTPSVSGVTPTWSLSPAGGGGYGLTVPLTSTSGNSITIQFFWHAADPESFTCTYVLTCQTSPDCVATKTIAVNVLDGDWGAVTPIRIYVLGREAQTTPGMYQITQTAYGTAPEGDPVYHLHEGSQFMHKTEQHEQKHHSDLTGGANSPVAVQAREYGDDFLADNNYLGNDYTLAEINGISDLVDIYIERMVYGSSGNSTSWMELRAYAISDIMNPRYFTRNEHP